MLLGTEQKPLEVWNKSKSASIIKYVHLLYNLFVCLGENAKKMDGGA